MLCVSNLSKRLGDRIVLADVSFSINRSDRLGLVGPNGAGKSTLLAILAGEIEPDSGSVSVLPSTRVGLLQQGFVGRMDGTLSDALDGPTRGLFAARNRLTSALDALGRGDATHVLLDEYAEALERFDDLGGYAAVERLETLLVRLGLNDLPLDSAIANLSGGEKTRAGLAALLAREPDVLLLDEPTNHLDMYGLEWLEGFVANYRGAVVVASHDRAFLDGSVTDILAFDPTTGGLRRYPGTYSDYQAARRREETARLDAYQRQRAETERIERDIRAVGEHARQTERATQHDFLRARAKKVARTAKVRERKLRRLLDSEDYLEKPTQAWGLAPDFAGTPESSRDVATMESVAVAFDGNAVLKDVSLHVRYGDRIALVGANGSGKTTLVRVLTGDLKPSAGRVRLGPSVVVGHYDQEQANVALDETVLDQAMGAASISETEARRFLHRFLFSEDTVHQEAGSLSYGERARLSLALLVLTGANFLLLDEPLNHLDLPARERFESALADFEGTLIAVLHDQYAVKRLANRVVELRDGEAREP